MFPANLTRVEARARSALLETSGYRVLVDLTGQDVAEPELHFVSTSEVTFAARGAGRTHVDLIADSVRRVVLDGVDLAPGLFADHRFPLQLDPGPHRLSVTAVCRYSRSGEGLHRFVDPADGLTYLYSQFEVSDARRVFACFEQPDLKGRFTVSVLAPAPWTVVSNGAVRSVTPAGDGQARWDFAETPPLSTYLAAVVAGDYAAVTDSYPGRGGEIGLAVLCRRSLTAHLDADRVLATTRSGFEVFERQFAHPYAFGKYDQVFVPEYNGGAMENAGCVTLRDDLVFRSRVTAAAYEARDNTILHELSHMWFGDLVSMRWWDDLWLKESFAEWASHFALSEAGDDPDLPWAGFSNSRKTWAYRQDQLPSTHPIAADMVDLEAVELNFDGITYAKGASVVRQLVAFVGLEEFLAGVRSYFRRHAYGSTELVDLLTALQETSGRDLSGWAVEWLQHAGVNTLRPRAELDDEGRFRSFVIEQTAPASHPTLRSHRLAIGLYALDGEAADGEAADGDAPGEAAPGGRLRRVRRVETDIAGPRTEVPELVGEPAPDLVLLNDDDLTYAKVRLDDRSRQTLVGHIHRLGSPLTRAVCWGAAWDMCRDAELPAADYVELALRGVAVESDLTAVGAVLAQALKAASDYTPRAATTAVLTRWETGLAELLEAAAAGSDHQVALARAYALAVNGPQGASGPDGAPGDGVERLRGWLAGRDVPAGLAVDASLRWTLVTQLARLGAVDRAEIDREASADPTITGIEQAAGARAALPTPVAKADAWRQVVELLRVPNETHQRICLQFWQRGQQDVLEPYVERYLQAAEDISASRGGWTDQGIALRRNVLAHLFPQPADLRGFLERLDGWLERTELTDSVLRVVHERRDDTVRALRCQEQG